MRFQRTLDQESAKASTSSPSEYPVYYFFYGTLTAPSTLQWILDLPEEPVLKVPNRRIRVGKMGRLFCFN